MQLTVKVLYRYCNIFFLELWLCKRNLFNKSAEPYIWCIKNIIAKYFKKLSIFNLVQTKTCFFHRFVLILVKYPFPYCCNICIMCMVMSVDKFWMFSSYRSCFSCSHWIYCSNIRAFVLWKHLLRKNILSNIIYY